MRKKLRLGDPLFCCFHTCRFKSKKLQTPLLYGTHLKSAHFTATSRCILSCLRYRRSASNFSNVLVILSINTSCSYCNLDCRIDCSISYVKKLVEVSGFRVRVQSCWDTVNLEVTIPCMRQNRKKTHNTFNFKIPRLASVDIFSRAWD